MRANECAEIRNKQQIRQQYNIFLRIVMDGYGVTFLAFLLDWLATAANQASFAIQKASHMEQEKRVQRERSDKTI